MLITTDSPAVQAGRATLEVAMVFGESTVTSAFASNPMKMLTPVSRGKSVWAYTSSFGGGLVAGDQTQLEISLGSGSCCFLGSQSSTKVYRNPAGLPCSHTPTAKLGADALLVFAPEPVQAFAESHYSQRQEFCLADGAGLVLLDWFTSGRAARGERWAFSHFESRNDVFINGDRAFVDPILLGSTAVASHMGRFNCLATLLLIGRPLKSSAEILLNDIGGRPVEKQAALVCNASPVRQGALLRIAGVEVEAVRHEIQKQLTFLRDQLGDDPWARKW
ncbi:MAG TPA: urease accessory protein UreD [Candidatus Binatia bacterium]|nr:urease accessory protein UreD [Candidatus Binatia bacterium]